MAYPVPDLVLYHKGCMDGLGAAWAVWRRFGGAHTAYKQVAYGEPPPAVVNKHVVIVDFSYPRDVLTAMGAEASSLLVLDHHKTALEALEGLPAVPAQAARSGEGWEEFHSSHAAHNAIGVHFDLERSGAMLAWNFFHDGPPPKLLRHVEDRDLWRFLLPGTRELHAAITAYPYRIEEFDRLVRRCGTDPALLMAEGSAILRAWDQTVETVLAATRGTMVIGGFSVPCANLPHVFASDAGHILASEALFSATYYDAGDVRVFSLRSRDTGMDVSLIAKAYGGGGHRNAAGFRRPRGWDGDVTPTQGTPA